MPRYICDKCQHEFSKKDTLMHHVEHNLCKDKDFECTECGKKFTTKMSMIRHTKTVCPMKKGQCVNNAKTLEQIIQMQTQIQHQLEEKFKQLELEVKQLKCNNENITNNINNGTVINANFLVEYGKEDLTKLSKMELHNSFNCGFNALQMLTQLIHFNPEHPEFHNIYISNMKDPYAMMYSDNQWTMITKEDLIEKIYEDKKEYIENNLELFVDNLLPSRKRALDTWLNMDDDDAQIKKIKKDIKLLLYNKKDMVVNNKKMNPTKTIKTIKDIVVNTGDNDDNNTNDDINDSDDIIITITKSNITNNKELVDVNKKTSKNSPTKIKKTVINNNTMTKKQPINTKNTKNNNVGKKLVKKPIIDCEYEDSDDECIALLKKDKHYRIR